jgi:hypothetical protein
MSNMSKLRRRFDCPLQMHRIGKICARELHQTMDDEKHKKD